MLKVENVLVAMYNTCSLTKRICLLLFFFKVPECYEITSIVKPHPIATTTSPTHHETGSWLDFVWLFV